MTGSPQTEPRVAVASEYLMSTYGWVRGAPIDCASNLIAALDAADEASGVRRVTAQELAAARQMREALQHLADRGLSADLTPTMNCRDTGTLYAGFSDYLQRLDAHVRDVAKRALSAADSPVGGVS